MILGYRNNPGKKPGRWAFSIKSPVYINKKARALLIKNPGFFMKKARAGLFECPAGFFEPWATDVNRQEGGKVGIATTGLGLKSTGVRKGVALQKMQRKIQDNIIFPI